MSNQTDRLGPPQTPRKIDPAKTFDSLVAWMSNLAETKDAPGFLVGISGTDSILAFLVCARAMENLGKPKRLLGVNFAPPIRSSADLEKEHLLAPNLRWIERDIVPWLKEQAPHAAVTVEYSPDHSNDAWRWATLIKRSLNGASARDPLKPGDNYWVVGTQNASEKELGTHSNLSTAVSVQPLVDLWKTEILEICAHKGVPKIALDRSRMPDCDCGRFVLAADHIEEVDAVLMVRKGLLSSAYLEEKIAPELLREINQFVDEQIWAANYKKQIPYKPEAGSIVKYAGHSLA